MAEIIERATAILWVLVAVAGLVLRARRLWMLSQLSYADPKDQDYLKTVITSSVLRGVVKLILLIGGLLALSAHPVVPVGDLAYAFWLWRCGVIVALILLLIEDVQVDAVRRRLGVLETLRRGHAP